MPTLPTTSIHQDENYWYEDGNIVIIANDEVAFRVYRGLLSRVSPLFNDLFSIGNPSGGEVVYDCPVLRVTDSSHDMRHLLALLLEPNFM